MINLHTKILDQLDAKELFLCLQIARHIGKNKTAWPGVDRLVKLTGWSKTTVLSTRKKLEDKGVIQTLKRKDELGRDRSNVYRLTTDLIGVFMGAGSIPDGNLGHENTGVQKLTNGGTKIEPGRVQKLNPGGTKIEPEVLSSRSINKREEREDTPQLSETEKAEAFIKAHTPPRNGFNPFPAEDKPEWGGGTEEDYQYIYQKIADHLNSNPRTWAEVASLAYCKMTPDQFRYELEKWIRHYLQDQRLFRNPVQQLRGGRISFYNWLKKPWAQKEYNPAYTDNNQQRSTAGTRRTVR
jgi:hypothetical protein